MVVQGGRLAKFVESVEVAMRLGIDPRRGDQMVRGVTSLPHGTGKEPKVAIFTGQDLDLAAASGMHPAPSCSISLFLFIGNAGPCVAACFS